MIRQKGRKVQASEPAIQRPGNLPFTTKWQSVCLWKTSLFFKSKEVFVSKDILKAKWNQVKGDIRGWWTDLTDDDVQRIQGDSEKFITVLQQRYGYGRQKAEQELNEFLNTPESQRHRRRAS